jgi:hypothetical protein
MRCERAIVRLFRSHVARGDLDPNALLRLEDVVLLGRSA